MDLESLLADRLRPAFAAVAGAPVDPAVRRSSYADFQSGAALGLGRPPRELAAAVVAAAELDDLCATVEVSGPGFVNLVVADRALGPLLDAMAADDRLGVPRAEAPETVVVDYSSPNVAKEMHVGHLRSTIIGDALVRVLEWRGHTVVRANHLGDWGTPFGMLIEYLDDRAPDDLGALYRGARAAFDGSAEFRERARQRVVALQGGDPETLDRWRALVALSERYFLSVYARLDVTLTAADFQPESAYNDRLAAVVADLDAAGLLRDSDGAACAFPAGFTGRDGTPLPVIVRKSDGGYGYAATDLAAIRHRTGDLGATRLLYVVGQEQRQHFAMVFAVAREAGWLTPPARAEHVDHGLMLGPDGRKLKSRSGDALRLGDLMDDAVAAAASVGSSPSVAAAVGIGALKYADLSTDRAKDYVFSLDRLLALDGNTAPYLQYAHARIRSLLAKASSAPGPIVVGHPAEHALALELLAFAPVVAEVEATLEPHRLAGHLYSVATAFSRFFESCPVLKAEPDVRASRLALSDLTARVLSRGLDLLGIRAPERM